ncbi:MAG TPA: histidine phosphatase family protein [Candidatus Binataceae bacterium]|nr:histidine phosphatase family protein [Candidatus Binataceae bacterium]
MALGPFYVAQKLIDTVGLKGTALLMRHGETDWNREGRVMGRHEVELNAKGRAQVESAARFAESIRPDLIVTSPLRRARQSAEIIAAGLGGIEIVEEPEIAEVLYGRWEGMTYHELIEDPHYLEYRKSPIEHPTPGGETIPEVQARGVAAVARAVSAHANQRILFVSHGDIIRTVLCHFMGLELRYFHRIRVDNATFSALQIAGNFAELKFLNLLPDPGRAFVSPFSTAKPVPPRPVPKEV